MTPRYRLPRPRTAADTALAVLPRHAAAPGKVCGHKHPSRPDLRCIRPRGHDTFPAGAANAAEPRRHGNGYETWLEVR